MPASGDDLGSAIIAALDAYIASKLVDGQLVGFNREEAEQAKANALVTYLDPFYDGGGGGGGEANTGSNVGAAGVGVYDGKVAVDLQFRKIRAASSLVTVTLNAQQVDLDIASDTDGTLAANSDAKVPTQKAVKTYVDTAVTGLLDFKGATDCSANPNYPAASKGDAYVVSVAGKIGGASGTSVDVGDVYLAKADNAGGTQAAVGTSWTVLEHNLVGALLSANNLSDLASASTARTNLGLGSAALLASDTDGTLAANSDSNAATQKATKTYADAVATTAAASHGAVAYTTPGSYTGGSGWLIPLGAQGVRVVAYGSGGSGGGAADHAVGTGARMGGAGGGGGCRVERTFLASDLGTPGTTRIDIVVSDVTTGGAGGTGGGAGFDGTTGSPSTFGSVVRAGGGGGGKGGVSSGQAGGGGGGGGGIADGGIGTTSGGTGGVPGTSTATAGATGYTGGNGGLSSTAAHPAESGGGGGGGHNSTPTQGPGGTSTWGGGGGGCGGGSTSTPGTTQPTAGGGVLQWTLTGGGGGAAGTSGATPTQGSDGVGGNSTYGGTGGGGGGSSVAASTAGKRGGHGGSHGGGGGGGGAGTDSSGGDGGNGGQGAVYVFWW